MQTSIFHLWLTILCSYCISLCHSHVRLVFPPARQPSLDFLDNVRTSGPCGVSKPPAGKGIRTTLTSGSSFNVSWDMAYPHQGGFRLELLNAEDVPITVLTPPEATYTGSFDQTAQSYRVQLPPKMECNNCAIRLLRQAKEWSDDYRFWSCADINIEINPDVAERCSNQGAFVDGLCRCNRLFSGENCQFRDECWADHECGINGKCQQQGERKVCYCKMGWFGNKCQSAFPFRKSSLLTTEYQTRTVGSDDNKIMWRVIHETSEIEVVLQYPGRSWVALGWKPQKVNPQCTKLGQTDWPRTHVAHPEPHHPHSEPHYPHSEPHPEPQPRPEVDPIRVRPEPQPEVPFILPNLPTHTTETRPGPEPLPDIIVDSMPIEIHAALPEPKPEPEAEPEPDSEPEPASTHAPPPPPVVRTSTPTPTPILPLIEPIIVNIPGGPPPLPDSFPITPPTSEENQSRENNNRPAPPLESSSYDDSETVELARGPIEIQPIFVPKEAIESIQPFVTESDSKTPPPPPPIPDERQYINEDCYGDWRWPAGCRDCDYRVSWTYIDETDEIEFSLETKSPTNWWSGLGFSKTGSMGDADIVVIKSIDQQLSLQDLHSNGYGRPKVDVQQDATAGTVVGSHINGVLRAAFTRKRNTGDSDDVTFSDSDCYYFLFPVSGGGLDEVGGIRKHQGVPEVSQQKICVRTCAPSPVLEETLEVNVDNVISHSVTTDPASCINTFARPIGCGGGDECDYVAKWSYNAINEEVRFEISSREIGRWTGIGLSTDGSMTNSDMYTGWVYDNKAYVTDRFAYGAQLPAIDPDRQNIYDIGGSIVDDIQTIWFTRKVVTEDTLTDFPLDECYYFLYPVGGGRVLARKEEDFQDASTPIGYHDIEQPVVSSQKVCICDGSGDAIRVRKKRQANGVYRNDVVRDHQLNPFANAEPQPHAEHHGHSHAEPHGHDQSHDHGHSHAELHPESVPFAIGVQRTEPEPQPELASLHPMDCADIIMGSAIGSLSRIQDMYTVSRATPMVDEKFSGKQDLTAATGFEEDGITTIIFRRKLHATDLADHSIQNDPMTVLWAKGQELGSYSHTAPSALETGRVSNPSFYTTDMLKYHGSKNRGSFVANFFDEAHDSPELCRDSFSYPSDCNGIQCDYMIEWSRDKLGVHFTIDARLAPGQWTGIGFSSDGLMSNADMVIVAVHTNGEIEITDRYSGSYQRPVVDSSQNIFNIHGKYNDGTLNAQFSRALRTDDVAEDADLTKCQYFLYPHAGGPIMDGTDLIRKHMMTPIVSSTPVCLQKCTGGKLHPHDVKKVHAHENHGHDQKPAFVVDEETKYLLSFRILNEGWNNKLVNPSQKRFQDLSRRVINGVGELLQPVNGYSQAQVLQYRASPTNEVIADIELSAAGVEELDIANAVQYPVSAGIVQGLEIDPGSVQVSKLANDPTPEQVRNYIIIGVAAFLILVAIVLAICLLARAKKSRQDNYSPFQQQSTPRYTPFSPYSYMVNGFPGAYPAGAYPYHPGPMPEKGGKGYDTGTYDPRGYNTGTMMSTHNRQYSNATTATPNGKTPSPTTDAKDPTTGETTYADWFSRVAAQPTANENDSRRPSATSTMPRNQPVPAPYISYPNDPYNYYTLNGRNPAANPTYGTASRQMYYRRDPY